ncbi:hypothetical protein BJY04DRAFT_204019 [Aspergillus karnatakaensis]|uniref:uncharacterized protein n=1 Tax=Aspergillus karnatakaensis TaxID=1810916 RepID=UPI003CCD0133
MEVTSNITSHPLSLLQLPLGDAKMSAAKRIVLRVPEYDKPEEFVDFYFTKFPCGAASDRTRYFVHLQPPSDFPRPNAKIHIVVDLGIQDHDGSLDQEFSHEVYTVRRGTNGEP